MSVDNDSGHPLEEGHKTTSDSTEIEVTHEYPSRLERLYEQTFTNDLPALSGASPEGYRRLNVGVESPMVRGFLGLDTGSPQGDATGADASTADTPEYTNTDGHADDAEAAENDYGWFYGQPMVASRSDERRAEMNARGQPADAIAEPDSIAHGEYLSIGPDRLTDPTGDQLTGTASGLDEYIPVSSTDDTVRLETTLVPLDDLDERTRRLRELTVIPEDEQTPREAEGLRTQELEVTLPSGALVPLRTLVPNPEDYSRSSISGIERRLALDAELKRVSAGIAEDGHMTGLAAIVDSHTAWLEHYRIKHERTIPDRRDAKRHQIRAVVQKRIYDRAAPLRELGTEDPELRDEILSEACRVLEGDLVHGLRWSPVELASELARRVVAGTDLTTAFLALVEDVQSDPSNVLRIRSILQADLGPSKGYVTTQGVVKKVYHPDVPGLKFGLIVTDGDRREDEVRIAVWESSEREQTASTADPDDADGRVIISKKTIDEPNEGDRVRLVDFKLPYVTHQRTYQGQPKLDSRWESEIEILDRASINASSDLRIAATPQRVGRSSSPSGIGEAVSRSPAATYSGRVSTHWPEPATMQTLIMEELASISESESTRIPHDGGSR
ncbi:hypothetical protein EFA46_015370 (plasmid) [Halarchaeum sp. CBA1220]|uniref:hypothetical protein n=1 Tax=Halarchaeum sp. CBA1220 TaxID=1853682 RepID=UPI0011CE73BA|nr:hypothetical protein [Halarchaeum sp. CBA1220]QLC35639.1 hypothetical protein EFA46_015370 [Halarchaeum sp. CBA1220]